MNHFSHAGIGPGRGRRRLPEPRPAEPGQWPKLEAALAVVNRDLTATLPGQDPLILMVQPACEASAPGAFDRDQVYVAMSDGRWHGNPVNACDLEEDDPPEPDDAATVLHVVADAAQSTVVELRWQVWPVCPEHRIGMHRRPAGTEGDWYEGATDAGGPPVWWCRGDRNGDGHDVALVGQLAATLPGRQRRALRRVERERNRRRTAGDPGQG
ncbi:hypothetical protein [Streptomyces collinus]|uniref:Uncharacterized protein n=1 Tax=Streptomyces collinus (strain DSM 40733 / Tue 365) TaxID=1214242 RepID=S5V6Y8_STRC3|nr:hypothetical protein [Streptomyces collinus]AGS67259.1 hypothetical protein B446_02135 [Streptomyces collinus Tu 365]AGS73436.1 hypothetical protein B446_33160 [Streptomyces collinus Tu 365]